MTLRSSSTPQFWILSVFLVLVFLTGGASRTDVQSLILLGPASSVACALALLTLKRDDLARYKVLTFGAGGLLLLVVLHLVPLPPSIWQNLPGRHILAEIDQAANLGDRWRPLTITPMNGVYSAISLLTPLAVLLLGSQLTRVDLYKLLPLLLGLGALSGLCGILQVIGSPTGPLYFYAITNNGSAVGLFSNRNHAAVLLACMFPMLAAFASTAPGSANAQRMRQILAMAALIVTVPLLLVTGSRSGLFVGLIGLLSATFLYKKPLTGRTVRKGGIRWRVGPAPLLIGIAVISLGLVTIVLSRAEAFNRVFAESAGEDSRAEFWALSLRIARHFMPWGSGIGSFVEAYQIFEPTNQLSELYVNHAHNDWIEIVLTMGAPGAMALLIGIAAIGRRSLRAWRQDDVDRQSTKFAKTGSVIIAMLAIASVTDYPLRTPSMMSLFAVCLLWLFVPEDGLMAPVRHGAARALGQNNGP